MNIPLHNNLFFVIDDSDYDKIKHLTFSLSDNRVMTWDSSCNKAAHLGRVILDVTDTTILVDHRNGDLLDYTRNNLRPCTHTQNMQNQKKPKNNTSGYKGVDKQGNRWRASISVERRRVSLGGFPTPKQAAIAYNEAAIKYHGEFAQLNIID